MESLGLVGSVLGCSAGIAVCGVVFAAYKLGLFYQLFHKVGFSPHAYFFSIHLSSHVLCSIAR